MKRAPRTHGDDGDDGELAPVFHHNIRTLMDIAAEDERRAPRSVRVADAITRFFGSIGSAAFHFVLFGGWLLVNSGVVPVIEPFDPFPFVMLAMFASVEAIFLTTVVLISQNRMAALSERRAQLELQVNLLAEHEVTRLVQLVDAIAERVGVSSGDVEDLKRDVRPEQVLVALERAEAGSKEPHADAADTPTPEAPAPGDERRDTPRR